MYYRFKMSVERIRSKEVRNGVGSERNDVGCDANWKSIDSVEGEGGVDEKYDSRDLERNK